MESLDKYLPIGTVVMLKGGNKRLMIVGFCSVTGNEENKVFDYSACTYPEGVLMSNKSILFNHNQIEKIYHLGLIDQEEIAFKNFLNNALKNMTEEDVNELIEKIKQNAKENKQN